MTDDCDAQIAQLRTEIAALEGALAQLAALPDAQVPLHAQLAAKKQSLAGLVSPSAPAAGDAVGGDKIDGDKVLGNKVVNQFFDGKPGENGETLLAAYLAEVVRECDQLRLYRLARQRHSGGEQSTTPPLRLQAVYTTLTIDGMRRPMSQARVRTLAHVKRLLTRLHLSAHTPEACEPEKVRAGTLALADPLHPDASPPLRNWRNTIAHGRGAQLDFEGLTERDLAFRVAFQLTRPGLVTEAIHSSTLLVLLGEPGGGKSTVLRYVALLLARRLHGEQVSLPGWPSDEVPVPILCPLGRVAAALPDCGNNGAKALWRVLGDILDGEQGLRAGLRDYLKPAIRKGGVLLLCDGLDELPAAAADGGASPRHRVAVALRQLAAQPGARVVVTSRALPYRAPGDWQLRAEEGWQEHTIRPLAFGQVRVFVQSWYDALAASEPDLATDEARRRAKALLAELESTERLRVLTRSPLLLTMLALLHYNTDSIPEDRARLYEECVQLLLQRWEPVRTPGLERQGLLDRLGRPAGLEVDQLRNVIHELALQAQDRPPGDDGCGLLDGAALEGQMLRFFRRFPSHNADVMLQTFLAVLQEDAGLLQARADDRFAFPHLTFQEYLAACALAERSDMVEMAYGRWQGTDAERWRTVLLLLMGRLRQQGQKALERDGVPWLKRLTARRLGRQDKLPRQRRRDALLAAVSYAEIKGRAALANSLLDIEAEVESPLRAAIVDLLAEPDDAIQTSDRIVAARVIGEIGDPRFPVSVEQWRAEQFPMAFGQSSGYWCYIPDGTYTIGGWDEGAPSANVTLPDFWIARFLITVAQYEPFVKVGYGAEAEHWWTPQGWLWKGERKRPEYWGNADLTQPNQPVVGVTWYEATAFANWLNETLSDNIPDGYAVQLPTEAEWEVAAAYDHTGARWPYPWGADEPIPERVVYDGSEVRSAVAVGCCPAGEASCGALDLVGNVWEWTAGKWHDYPQESGKRVKDPTPHNHSAPLRGGSHLADSTNVCCGVRYRDYPDVAGDEVGFRVVVTPRLAQ